MLRILYVEDNAANLSLVYRVAQMGGHEIINRTTGEKALADFEEIRPDLVLMDVQLEGKLTGLDVVEVLRKRGCKLPIVAVTAYAMKGDRERALAAGCDDYLPKPLPIKKLIEMLETYQQQADEAKTISQTLHAVQAEETDTEENTETLVAPKIEDKEKTITTEAARKLDPQATTTTEAARKLDPNPTVTAKKTDANAVVTAGTEAEQTPTTTPTPKTTPENKPQTSP